jgi:hypothetical protein
MIVSVDRPSAPPAPPMRGVTTLIVIWPCPVRGCRSSFSPQRARKKAGRSWSPQHCTWRRDNSPPQPRPATCKLADTRGNPTRVSAVFCRFRASLSCAPSGEGTRAPAFPPAFTLATVCPQASAGRVRTFYDFCGFCGGAGSLYVILSIVSVFRIDMISSGRRCSTSAPSGGWKGAVGRGTSDLRAVK